MGWRSESVRIAVAMVIALGVGAGLSLSCTERTITVQGCEAYLSCLVEIDPERFEDERAVYGGNGSCFHDSSAETCHATCLTKLDEVGSDDEACQAPPQPSTNPSGLSADCGAITSGPTIGPGAPGVTGFPEAGCNPRTSGEGAWKCCSDDPAAEGGRVPSYQGKDIAGGGTPYFSGANNALGTSGLCIKTSDIPAESALLESAAANCPIPCNPTWERELIDAVCGEVRMCCQTHELHPEDCVFVDGVWRPVTGDDIGMRNSDGEVITDWNPGAHHTHQDPAGIGCLQLAGDELSSEVFTDCVRQLSVADQRGFCLTLAPGQVCPTDDPSYVSACDRLNGM